MKYLFIALSLNFMLSCSEGLNNPQLGVRDFIKPKFSYYQSIFSCTLNPSSNLSLVESAKKRLVEEMGIKTNLNEVFSFIYQAEFDNGLSEYEYDHVLFGISNNQPILNPDEAIDYRWIKISDLKAQIEKNPGNFTVWLQIMINNYFKYFEDYENNSL